MLKTRVLDYLNTVCRPRLQAQYDEIKAKNDILRPKIKAKYSLSEHELRRRLTSLDGKEQIAKGRLNDLDKVYREIVFTPFEECEDWDLVSEGAFCDRKTLFYHWTLPHEDDDVKAASIVLSAFLNSQQDYFLLLHLSRSKSEITRYLSQLMMYHIGFITEKVWYCQQHWKMSQRVYTEYPHFKEKYPVCTPTQYQADYMIRKVIFDTDQFYGEVNTQFSTDEAIEASIELERWEIMESGIIYRKTGMFQPYEIITVYLLDNKDGTYTRVHPEKRELKDHKQASNMAKKFMGEAV